MYGGVRWAEDSAPVNEASQKLLLEVYDGTAGDLLVGLKAA